MRYCSAMPNYRRAFVPGGMFFFTLVTFERRPILTTDVGRRLLHAGLAAAGGRWPFGVDAMVLLPDHLHAIWTLPPGDADFSRRWAYVKRHFTAGWLAHHSNVDAVNVGGRRRWGRRRSVWQPRFYEHQIRDEPDRDRHFDYLHFNPVKHGHATCPHAWPWSSFDRCVRAKVYLADWSCACEGQTATPPDFSWADALE